MISDRKVCAMAIANKIHGFMTQSSFIRKMFEEGIRLKRADTVRRMSSISVSEIPISILRRPSRRGCCELVSADIPGKHMYMPNAGYPETRAAVAAEVGDLPGVCAHADQIVMTCGAGGALNVILKTILDPGDEVIMPAPFFVEYRFYADNAGGVSRIVPTQEDFSLDLDAIRQAVTEKTKAVLINSPNNPTGKVFDEAIDPGACGDSDREGKGTQREIF